MAEKKSDILQGTLDLMVLKTLDAMGPMHGYGIARRIEQISDEALQVNQGTIYLCLIRLVQKGWINAGVGHLGEQPQGEVLRHLEGRPETARGRDRELGARFRGHRTTTAARNAEVTPDDRIEGARSPGFAHFSRPASLIPTSNRSWNRTSTMLSEDNVRGGMTPQRGATCGVDSLGCPYFDQGAASRGPRAAGGGNRAAGSAFCGPPDRQGTTVLGRGNSGVGARHRCQRDRLHRGECRFPPRAAGRGCRPALHADAGRVGRVAASTFRMRELQDWHDQSRTFAGLAAFTDATMNISDDRALPEQAEGTWLTANAFGALRQRPLLGRDFAVGDERKGAEPVVIIGYGLWKNRYGARSERARDVSARERTAGNDHRRHARAHEVSRQHRALGAVRPRRSATGATSVR